MAIAELVRGEAPWKELAMWRIVSGGPTRNVITSMIYPFAKFSRKDRYCGKALVATKLSEQPFQFKVPYTQTVVPVPPLPP